MGESVNTGSRLENVTRVYGSWILVSESTQQACKGIVFREVDFVQVKGRHKPIRCFEPLGLDTDITATRLAEIDRWHQALSAYRSQQWDTALSLLRPLHELRPVDRLYELFISRCEQYKSSPPEPSWDGVTTFETKKG